MDETRPLRDVLADGGEDGDGLLGELPPDLLATAVGSYAGTAPAEVAEHLAPVLGGDADLAAVLEALASAPTDLPDEVAVDGDPAGLDDDAPVADVTEDVVDLPDLPAPDFGSGAEDVDPGTADGFDVDDDVPDPVVVDDGPVTGLEEVPAEDVVPLHLDPLDDVDPHALDELDDLDD